MEKHFIIGTAGHVDHGKTMLVKALTGQDTDRLKEEKERGISIELGFAPLKLPSGVLAGLVDVPGHERFIKNMLAGVGGMDLVLLVIAADEGVMPQTSEHLDIIRLLQVPKGILVISKIDMVDSDWLDLVQEEITEKVKGTIFDGAPIVRVSSVTKEGVSELLSLIDKAAKDMESRRVTGWPRMAIDRVFSITGFGTVVTGTLLEGRLKPGDPLEILPKGIETKVRTLQVHGKKVEQASAGQRVAVNLSNIDLDEVKRGDVISWPGRLKPSHRLDVKLHLLASAPKALANRTRVRVHLGTSEVLGRIILLDREELKPGETSYTQIECEEPMVAQKNDRFVIRSYSPMHTIGGGSVVDPAPKKHKRFKQEVLDALATIEKGTPEELIIQALDSSGEPQSVSELAKSVGLAEEELSKWLSRMKDTASVKAILVENREYYISAEQFAAWGRELEGLLKTHHSNYPLRSGMAKEEIRSKVFNSLNNKVYNALMRLYETEEMFTVTADNLALYGYKPVLTVEQENYIEGLGEKFKKAGFQPPAWREVAGAVSDSEEILSYLLAQGILVKLDDNIYIHSMVFEKGRDKVVAYIQEKGEITLGEARDILDSSRKYVLPFLNRLDKDRVTRRVEDKRILYR